MIIIDAAVITLTASSVAFEQTRQKRRPGELAISIGAQLGHQFGNIDAELMGRRVLAGVITVAAIETEIGEIGEIGFGENAALLHRRKHRAVSFAVTAGVADRHLPRAVFDQIKIRHSAPPPARRSGRKPNRWSSRIPPDNLCREYCPPSFRPRQKYFLPAVRLA